MEFGTVLIYTCSQNCAIKENNLEHVILQEEPDSKDFK